MSDTDGLEIEPEHTWAPITELPDGWESLADSELKSLERVWADQYSQLKESRAVEQFNERLLREWSIETGILERLYTIDHGVTQLLIEQGIDAALIPHGATNIPIPELVRILRDHRDALEGLFDFVGNRLSLTPSYILQLHQVITHSQEYVEARDQFGNTVQMTMVRGKWKTWPNNPTRPDGCIHEYCPPLQVASEMDRLVTMYNSHQSVPPEINAAWLHHRFTQIHPFQDGNGRVARALATIVFLQAGWFPLVINRDQRSDYITALEAADCGDLAPLVRLFGQNAKRAFTRALEHSEDTLEETLHKTQQKDVVIPQVVDGLVDIYRMRRMEAEREYQQVERLAEYLSEGARSLLDEVSATVHRKFASIPQPPELRISRSNPQNTFYYTMQIVDTAKALSYWANVSRQRIWVRLHMYDPFADQRTQIVFSFHYLGKINRGVMVSSGFIYFPVARPEARLMRDDESEVEPQFGETHRICSEPFFFSYQDMDRKEDLTIRFHAWMSEALSVGLAEWARRL